MYQPNIKAYTYSDPGADTWSATVDYGDGSGEQPLVLNGKTFSLSHVYAQPGTYSVTIRVMDGGTAPGTAAFQVVVAGEYTIALPFVRR